MERTVSAPLMGVQKISADSVQMRKHRSFGGVRVSAHKALNDRRVLVAIFRAPLEAEGAPLDLNPLILITDEFQDRMKAHEQFVT